MRQLSPASERSKTSTPDSWKRQAFRLVVLLPPLPLRLPFGAVAAAASPAAAPAPAPAASAAGADMSLPLLLNSPIWVQVGRWVKPLFPFFLLSPWVEDALHVSARPALRFGGWGA